MSSPTRKLLLLQALAISLASAFFVSDALAQTSERKDLVLKGDARCTRCHDAEDNPQILEIGKTRHPVRLFANGCTGPPAFRPPPGHRGRP